MIKDDALKGSEM